VLSFLTHFNAVTQGLIEARDVVFFISLITFWLFANVIIVDLKRAG
jgi:ABC-2 type transport system permease protein